MRFLLLCCAAAALSACSSAGKTRELVILEGPTTVREAGPYRVYETGIHGTNSHVLVIVPDAAAKQNLLEFYAPQTLAEPKRWKQSAHAVVHTLDEYLSTLVDPYREPEAEKLKADLATHAAVIYRNIADSPK